MAGLREIAGRVVEEWPLSVGNFGRCARDPLVLRSGFGLNQARVSRLEKKQTVLHCVADLRGQSSGLSECSGSFSSVKQSCGRREPGSLGVAKAVTDSAGVSERIESAKKTQYHFLIANAKFMLDEEEHFQELLRERLRHFQVQGRQQDFWLVIEPQFLAKFPDISKRLSRPAVALVSTDSTWITFMKLRLDRVLKGVLDADSSADALASNSVDLSFEKPAVWTAPYTKYETGWWTPFLPPQEQ